VRRLGFLGFPALLVASACGQQDTGTLQIITGEETDTFTQSPVPTQIVVTAVDSSGKQTTLATASYPTDTIDLGKLDESVDAEIQVTAKDATGKELVYGASVEVQYGALVGATLPVFVQRVGQSARLPNPPTDARPSPTMGVLSNRYLIIAGGSDATLNTTTQVYDFGQFNLLGSPPSLPIVPSSMPIVNTVALLISPTDGQYYDFSQNLAEDVTPPGGFAFADVAGGQTIYDPSGKYVFVVGATRTTGGPTAAVLQIDTTDTSNSTYVTGNMTWLTLSVPRLGASAAFVPDRGLVVAGGNATAAGVEVIAPGQVSGGQVPYPPDASSGAGMTLLDGIQTMLLAGGLNPDGTDAGVRSVVLGCASSCVPQAWGSGLTPPLTSAAAFAFNAANAFVVGSEAQSGLTHTFLLTTSGATEVPTKVQHTNAAAIESPMGSSVLIYGGANEIESFTWSP
jgi:hypothetical protein